MTGDGAAGAQVEAGKYVSESIYLGVRQGATVGSNAAKIEIEVAPNVRLESELTATGTSSIGTTFKWDY